MLVLDSSGVTYAVRPHSPDGSQLGLGEVGRHERVSHLRTCKVKKKKKKKPARVIVMLLVMYAAAGLW